MEYSNTKIKAQVDQPRKQREHLRQYQHQSRNQQSKQQLNNDVLHRIFQLSGIKCHVCQRKLNATNIHTFLKEKTVSQYYCSVDCYNHI